ncbi:MAG TPA: hypothetical protein VM848_07700 [Acidimicrobiia bacterium]|nr:hypothetical protein [Acidimicrobiia bacterium]
MLDGSGTFGAKAPDPEGRIYPVALVAVGSDELVYERTDDVGLSSDLPVIEYALDFLPSRTQMKPWN